MSIRDRVRRGALGTIAVVAVLAAGPAAAQTTTVPAPTVSTAPTGSAASTTTSTTTTTTPPVSAAGVTLLAQPAWTALGGHVPLRLRVDTPAVAPGTDLVVRVHNRITTRIGFERSVLGDSLGGRISTLRTPLASLPADANGEFVFDFGLSGSDVTPSVAARAAGVYPVEVGLDGPDGATDPFVTWIVAVDTSSTPVFELPLVVAWIWQLEDRPLLRAERENAMVLADMRPGGRLDRLATLLEDAAALPLTVELSPETLESWQLRAQTDPSLAAGIARVQQAAARPTTQVLPAPYVPLDLPAFLDGDFAGKIPEQYVKGAATLDALTTVTPNPRSAFVDPVNDRAVAQLRQMLLDRVVVRADQLVPVEERFTPAQPFDLSAGGGRPRAAATMPAIEALMETDVSPALRAQRVLAALAEVAFETPAVPRGIVLAAPTRWSPDVDTVRMVMDGLRSHPLLRAATLDTFFEQVPPAVQSDGQPVERTLAPAASTRDPAALRPSDYDDAQHTLTAYRGLVGDADPSVAAGERALAITLSTDLTPKQARAELDVIERATLRFTRGVTTASKRITLTSRRAAVPISFSNNTGHPVRVRIRLASSKLLFPEGTDRTLELPPGLETQRFAVEARASGTFPMTITVTSADGQLQLGPPTQITVRSAVFGNVGPALTGGALAFLALWWANHFRRVRRGRRLATESV